MRQNLVLIVAHTEEVGLFLELIRRSSAVGAVAVEQVGFGPEGFAGCTIPVFIFAKVNVSLGLNGAENFLNGQFMAFLRGTDEVGV